ncbi:MAG: glycoside hydrolase family 65 protein [Candidatus Omnitrophica bacterium]|nr:glycoside hydrolase family 65 protein [Candidatus Omnitrophota bacterium]
MSRRSKTSNGSKELKPSEWTLEYKGFEPSEESLREALCTLSNGYFGTRGAANEASASRISYPGTYIAGVYNKLATEIAGRKIYNEDLVNCPNWLPVTFRLAGGEWISLEDSEVLSNTKRLDFRRGILFREIVFSDNKGRKVRVLSERIVHMEYPHIGAISYEIRPEDYEGNLYIRSSLDGTVENTGVARYRKLRSRHLKADGQGFTRDGIAWLSVVTSRSDVTIAQASKTVLYSNGKKFSPEQTKFRKKKKMVRRDIKIKASRGDSFRIEKTVAIYTSRDRGVKDPAAEAKKSVRKAPSFAVLKRKQVKAWEDIWKTCGFNVDDGNDVQKIINFHTFHLLQTATRHNRKIDAALPARGLHGESYRGHIFWDELFVMPLYDYQMPVVSRALLKYRFERIGKAREYADEEGYRGAMFPWQSGSTGEEETQVLHLNPMSGKWGPDYSRNQRHISFAIAYNVWKYWERTGDKAFMDRYGSEIFLSIAEFCSSLAEFSEKDGRFHTHGLMGPDEFHEKMPFSDEAGYTDNAYSNAFIVWILLKAEELLNSMSPYKRRRLMEKCGLKESSPELWKEITRAMNLIIREDGIIAQFEGYFKLKELNWKYYSNKYGDIHRMDRILKAEGKSPNAYKVAKQADVLMLFYVFSLREVRYIFRSMGYDFRPGMLRKNYDYYIKRTSHGSTLSKVVHCYLAHVMGRKKEAWRWYLDVLDSDINDVQGGTTPEGIHTGVMGGSLDIIMRGFAGIDDGDGKLRIAPKPPSRISKIDFTMNYREKEISVSIKEKSFFMELKKSGGGKEPFVIEVYGKKKELVPGKQYRFSLKKGG